MSPMHPYLRQALLRDPEHRRRGLTAQILLEYERLLAQLFYATYYDKEQSGSRTSPPPELVREIEKFRQQWLPNFEMIHAQWVQRQKRAMQFKLLSSAPPRQIIKTVWNLLRAVFTERQGKTTGKSARR